MAESTEKEVKVEPQNTDNKQDLNYDFNFENQVEQKEEVVVAPPPPEVPNLVKDEVDPNAVADPAIGKVNPNPVKPDNVVPVDVDSSAGLEVEKEEQKEESPAITASEIKTSGTATEEEIIVDATTQSAELLDEYAIKMDAATAKKQEKKNLIFIILIFLIFFIFIFFLRPLIKFIGY